jgi:hypothetical protein
MAAPTISTGGRVQVIDNEAQEVMGEVQASPTQYTVLARLKNIADAVGGGVVVTGALTDEELRASPVPMTDDWHPVELGDATANSSNKVYAVPADTEYLPFSVYVELVATETVGSRQLVVEFRDASDNVIASARAAVVQTAGLTCKYLFAINADRLWAFLDTDHLTTPLPLVKLAAGWDIHVWDKAAIAAAADDMTVRIIADARSV